MTSSADVKVSLFTKENCAPCLNTKQYIYDNFYQDEADWPLLDLLTIFRKEDHPALVESFDLNLYPTLVIHQDGKIIDKVVGGKNIRGSLRYLLTEINQANYENQ